MRCWRIGSHSAEERTPQGPGAWPRKWVHKMDGICMTVIHIGCLVWWYDSRFGCRRPRAQFPEQPFCQPPCICETISVKVSFFSEITCIVCERNSAAGN